MKRNNWFYKGYTIDIQRRLKRHNKGIVSSTKPYRPFKLVYYEAYLTKNAVKSREKSVKKSGSVWKPLMDRIKDSMR